MFKIELEKHQTIQSDNKSAYDELQRMMRTGYPLSVSFGIYENYPCVFVSDKNTKRFPYQIKEESLNGLFHYLQTGEITDFDSDPMNLSDISQEEINNFNENTFKQFIESGLNIQYTPLFREYSGNITGLVTLKKGTIFLKTKRTPEFMDYLREYRGVA